MISTNFGIRMNNPSRGRFLSVDPLTKCYPELTPYSFANNRPINAIDLDGLEPKDSYANYQGHDYGHHYGDSWRYQQVNDKTTSKSYWVASRAINGHYDQEFQYADVGSEFNGYKSFTPEGYRPNSEIFGIYAASLSSFGAAMTKATYTSILYGMSFTGAGVAARLMGHSSIFTLGGLTTFSISQRLIAGGADAGIQYAFSDDGWKSVNWLSTGSQLAFPNPFTTSIAGNTFDLSYNSFKQGSFYKPSLFQKPLENSISTFAGGIGNSFSNGFGKLTEGFGMTLNSDFIGSGTGNTIGNIPGKVEDNGIGIGAAIDRYFNKVK